LDGVQLSHCYTTRCTLMRNWKYFCDILICALSIDGWWRCGLLTAHFLYFCPEVYISGFYLGSFQPSLLEAC
jgi:hypothetical protein